MTRPVDPYSRLYWRLIDDPKFVGIYDDDHAFALWGRLLMAADMAWPASAALPLTTRKASLATLVDAGLVDVVTGGRYRIHGLDSERGKRQQRASDAAGSRWGPPGSRPHPDSGVVRSANGYANGIRTGPVSIPSGMPRRDEPRRDETSTNARAHEGLPNITEAVQEAGETITGRGILAAGDKQLTRLDQLVERHGSEGVVEAMVGLANGGQLEWAQLVWGIVKVLDPIPTPLRGAEAKAVEHAQITAQLMAEIPPEVLAERKAQYEAHRRERGLEVDDADRT